MRCLKLAGFLLTLLLFTPAALADLPLSMEDLLARNKEYRLDLNLTYLSQQRDQTEAFYEFFEVGAGQFINLPGGIVRSRINRDVLAMAISLRRGITPDTEIYATLVVDHTDTREQFAGDRYADTSTRFTELSIGASREFVSEGESPGVVGYGELTLLENQASEGTQLVHAESMQIGATLYRTYDPVVISLSMGYLYNGTRPFDSGSYDPGDIVYLTPSFSFAINNELSLSSAVYYRLHHPGRFAGQDTGVRYSELQFGVGMSASRSDRLVLRMDGRFNISSNPKASITFEVSYNIPSAKGRKSSAE